MTTSTTNSSSKNEGSLPKVGYWRRDLEGMRQRRLRAAELFHHGATQAEVARTLQVSRQAASVWHARLKAGGTTAWPVRAARAAGHDCRPSNAP